MGADAGPLLFPIQTAARRLFGSALALLGLLQRARYTWRRIFNPIAGGCAAGKADPLRPVEF